MEANADTSLPPANPTPGMPMPTEIPFDVFLSHNSKDKPMVRQLGKALKERGLAVWLDEWELVPGQVWQEALEAIIKTARSAAVLIGKDGFGPWEAPEMRACLSQFVKRKLPVIPVLLPDAPTQPELPLFLQAFTWVDLRGGLNDDGLDRLEWGITGKKTKNPKPGGSTLLPAPTSVADAPGAVSAPSADPAAESSNRLIVNFVSILAAVLGWSAWFYFYTSAFPVIVSLFTLSGVFITLPVVFRIVPDDQTKKLREKLNVILERRYLWVGPLAVLLFGVVWWNITGTIEIENHQPGAAGVWVYHDKKGDHQAEQAPANGSIRSWQMTNWWSPATYHVKVAGLPEKEVQVWPASIVHYQIPFSFLCPVVLIDYKTFLVGEAISSNEVLLLHVSVDGRDLKPQPFDGRPVWIGCAELELPAEIRKKWQDEGYLKEPAVADKYLAPRAHAEAVSLNEGQKVEAWIVRQKTGTIRFHRRSTKARQPQSTADLVQLLTLDNE